MFQFSSFVFVWNWSLAGCTPIDALLTQCSLFDPVGLRKQKNLLHLPSTDTHMHKHLPDTHTRLHIGAHRKFNGEMCNEWKTRHTAAFMRENQSVMNTWREVLWIVRFMQFQDMYKYITFWMEIKDVHFKSFLATYDLILKSLFIKYHWFISHRMHVLT